MLTMHAKRISKRYTWIWIKLIVKSCDSDGEVRTKLAKVNQSRPGIAKTFTKLSTTRQQAVVKLLKSSQLRQHGKLTTSLSTQNWLIFGLVIAIELGYISTKWLWWASRRQWRGSNCRLGKNRVTVQPSEVRYALDLSRFSGWGISIAIYESQPKSRADMKSYLNLCCEGIGSTKLQHYTEGFTTSFFDRFLNPAWTGGGAKSASHPQKI